MIVDTTPKRDELHFQQIVPMKKSVPIGVRVQTIDVGHHRLKDLALLFLCPAATEHRIEAVSLFVRELTLTLVRLHQEHIGLFLVPEETHLEVIHREASRQSSPCHSSSVLSGF